MRILHIGRYALGAYAAAMLAGCGGGSGTPLSPSPAGVGAEREHVRSAYSAFYSFKGYPNDGAYPEAGLINVNGTLYGTTANGGVHCKGTYGCGTVFAITSGGETVLHSFKGYPDDGGNPDAGLINVNGTLYGTTSAGGASGNCSGGCGTVFKITTSGRETVLHSFEGGSGNSDGYDPVAGLLNVGGTLYGTTYYGGAKGDGTVFKITTSGKETVLHSFGNSKDGHDPLAGLINVKGTLYGTTEFGGASYDGTVFSITLSGAETVLHSFAGGSDGESPEALLLDVNGTLYGTTFSGGGTGCYGSVGCGTVFKITTSGKEAVLHSFGGSGDGYDPVAGLINVEGALYGTTEYGGAKCSPGGCGTVFAITTSGKETLLYSFGGSGDGENPEAALLDVNGTLYGTTAGGGANNYGTAFSVSP
ncbi:MAG TPA: choice-of-anchor tandem repeat GloVer-containing protein [Candidatus Cybelea sp.]|nr:choice-of-anchor tandem repeat GloVer-containing protein [Candidatus Cybelea sp.]